NAVKRGNNVALATTAAAESAKPWWKRLADELTSLGQQFAGGRLQQLLLAEEDRMLLDQAGYGHSQGQAVFLAARLLAAVALPVGRSRPVGRARRAASGQRAVARAPGGGFFHRPVAPVAHRQDAPGPAGDRPRAGAGQPGLQPWSQPRAITPPAGRKF